MNLLPPLQGGLGPLALLPGRAHRPAGAVRRDLFPDGLAEPVPQVPAVTDLHRRRPGPPDGLAIGPGPVTARDLGPRVLPQPVTGGVRGPAGNDVDPPARPGAGEHARLDQAAAQREVAGAQHPGDQKRGKRDPQQRTQGRVPRCPDAGRGQQPGRGPAR